ncbi:MAG: DsbA family protein [bacterium]
MALRELAVPPNDQDWQKGNQEGLVTIVEYGDFQCPVCYRAYSELKEVFDATKDVLSFIYRHFPLTDIHQYALISAEASEAAGAQGNFWDMHDTLFEHQPNLSREKLIEYATTLKLDLSHLNNALDAKSYRNEVVKDIRSGQRSGVKGTPALFINGTHYEGPLLATELIPIVRKLAKTA